MNLHPDLLRLLDSVQRRQRRLLWWRATLTAGTILGAGTILAALLDAPLSIEDRGRITMALLIFSATSAGLWLRAGRRLARPATPRDLALLIEERDPNLQGTLLSAVELSEVNGPSGGSKELRELLQARAAASSHSLVPEGLLPWNLIKKDSLAALAMLLVLGVGFFIEGSRFGTRCLRILLPLADIARPSDVYITILSPDSPLIVVPEGEPVKVIAEVHGYSGGVPVVLVSGNDYPREPVAMRGMEGATFSGVITPGQAPLEYRVRAGDALGPKMKLTPKPRPKVVEFEKTYQPPSYTGLPSTTETSPEGMISGLEGSRVKLTFRTDQPVRGGSLAISCGQNTEIVSLAPLGAEANRVSAEMHLQKPGVYLIALLSQETGFSSAKDLQYAISVAPDEPPVVSMTSPERDLVLPIGETLNLRAHAEDDLGLASVSIETRVNKGPWHKRTLSSEKRKELELTHTWDPLSDRPKAGDIFILKFTATDSKGQTAESRELHVGLSQPQTLPKASTSLAALREKNRRLEELTRQTADAARAIVEAKAETEARTPNALKRDQALARAQDALETASTSVRDAREALQRELRTEQPVSEQSALRTQAQALNRIEEGQLEPARRMLQQALGDSNTGVHSAEAADSIKLAAEAASKGAALANTVKEAVKTQLAAVEAKTLESAAQALSNEQTAVREALQGMSNADKGAASDVDMTEALRRQQVNQAAAGAFQKELQTLAERSGTTGQRLAPASASLNDANRHAERAIASAQTETPRGTDPRAASKVIEAGLNVSKNLERTAKALEEIQPSLAQAAERAQQKLLNETTGSAERVSQLSKDLEAIQRNPQLSQDTRQQATRVKLEAEAAVLRADALTEASRLHAPAKTALDLRTAAAALDSEAQSQPTASDVSPNASAKAAAAAKALQTLEASARLEEVRGVVERIAQERSEVNGPLAPEVIEAQKKAAGIVKGLDAELRKSGLPEASAAAVQEGQEALGTADPGAAHAALKALQTAAARAKPSEDKARADLAQMAPSLAARMETLARAADANAAATDRIASMQAEGTTPVPRSQVLAEEQLAKKTQELRRELQADANSQDTTNNTGRARARDADDAAAQLKDASNALQSLKEANASKAEAPAALRRAAEQQRQNAETLSRLASHFKNLDTGSPEAIAESREALRKSEQRTGTQDVLEARETKAKDMASLMASKGAEAKAQLEAMVGENQKTAPVSDTSSKSAAAAAAEQAKEFLSQALTSLKNGEEGQAQSAIASAAAMHSESDRQARRDEGTSDGGDPATATDGSSPSNSEGLPSRLSKGTGKAWGNLPQRIADDLMQGKREAAPSEYRGLVDAYFQTLAEKARGTKPRP